MNFRNVTILLPAMDETYSLEQTVTTIQKQCNSSDIAEFIFILCDRSTQECKQTAEKLVEKLKDYANSYIHYQEKPFIGGAIQEGFELAKGSHVVLMSSDLETPPVLISKFIELAKKNPDKIITASRWIRGGGFEKYSKIKLVCNLIFERLIALFYCVGLTDLTYAYRIFPSELVKKIYWEESKHPFFLETALKPLRLGISFIEIPARWTARTEGKSQNSFFANFKYFKTAWKIRFMKKENILRNGEF